MSSSHQQLQVSSSTTQETIESVEQTMDASNHVLVNTMPVNNLMTNHLVQEEPESPTADGPNPDSLLTTGVSNYGCENCKSLSVDNEMLDKFAIRICYACKVADPELKLMTKSRAKEEFMLNDTQLSKLMSMTKANPRKSGWSDMKLFCVRHLKETAIQEWGSLEAVEVEKERRLETRMKRKRSLKRKKGEPSTTATEILQTSIQNLRSEIIGVSTRRKTAHSEPKQTKPQALLVHERYHTHSFEPVGSASEGSYGIVKEVCKGCGMERETECM